MTDRLIRELLVDIKQRGGSKAAKQIRDVEAALDGATQSSEGLNVSLGKLPGSFTALERSVSRTAKSLEKLSSTTSITALAASIGMLSGKFTAFEADLAKSVLKINSNLMDISTTANKMASGVSSATASSVGDLNRISKVLLELDAHATSAAKVLQSLRAGAGLADLGSLATQANSELNTLVGSVGRISKELVAMSAQAAQAGKALKGIKGESLAGISGDLSKISSGLSTAVGSMNSEVARINKLLLELSANADLAGKAVMSITPNKGLVEISTEIQKLTTGLANAARVSVAEISKIRNSLTSLIISTTATSKAMQSMGSGFDMGKVISELTAATATSTSDINKITASLKQMAIDAGTASKALQSIKAGPNLSSVPNVIGKIGDSMTRLRAQLDGSVSGIEKNLNELAKAFATMGGSGNLNPLGNSIKGIVPTLNLMAKAANQVNAALSKIQSGKGLTALPAQLKASVTALESLETKLASTANILDRGFSKGFQDLANKAANASTRMVNNFQKVIPELTAMELAAIKTGAAIEKLIAKRVRLNQTSSGAGGNVDMAGLLSVANQIENAIDNMSSKLYKSMESAGRASEIVADKLTDLNTGVGKVNKGLGGLNSTLGGTSTAAARASRAIGNTSGAARGATRDFAAMADVGGKLPMMYAMIASNVFVAAAAFEQLKLGDQMNRLMEFGTIVGASTGVPVQNLAKALQEATGYAVSFEEAMRQASAAAAYGFTSDQISEFALVARRAAAVLGVDMTDALNRVVKGISKQEIELMDELGITIRLNEAYDAYVKQLNMTSNGVKYTADSLSSYQKQQAYANAVVTQSTKLFGNLDHVLRATPWETFAANADTALKNIQMAAAKYLTPVANLINNIFYQSKIAGMLEQAEAAAATNAQIDPKNTAAMVASYQNAKKALNDMEDASKGYNVAIQESQDRIRQIDKQLEGMTTVKTLANMLLPGDFKREIPRDQQKLLDEKLALEDKISQAERERANTMQARAQLQNNLEERTNALLKAQPQLAKEVAETGKTIVDPTKVKVLGDLTSSMASFSKNIAPDIKTAMADLTDNKNLGKVVGQLSDVKKEIEQQAGITGESVDDLAKKYGLGVNSMKELNDQLSTAKTLQTLVNNESANELALQQKKNDLLKSGMDSKKVDVAISNMEVGMLDKQIAAYEDIKRVNGTSAVLENKINELKTKRLTLLNGQYGKEEKVKDVRDKVVGIEREIALLNNRTMTDSQYNVARLQMELAIEKDRFKILEGNAKKEREREESRRNIAAIEREIWKEQLDRNAKTADMRKEAFERSQSMKPLMGESQRMQEQLTFYQEMKEFTKGNADEQARWSKEIANTTAQMAALKSQRNAQMMDRVGQSVGADYTPTTGLEGEDKKFADMENQMASYDTAISKLSQLNSEATATAQSMGNLANAMIQFSQGSLDTTSMIAAGMQTVSQMISYGTNQQISAIDAAIAAEQKRDGKSEQSKNKIKKMEAEKIKLQQESAKKQIIIQTAVAVMQAATAVPYPFSIPLMIAAGLAGALSLAQASSATGMTDIAGSGGDTASYLTLGERQKNVDVSMGASAGELSYVRGDKGIGSANGFIPRAEGGNTYPGVSYKMGEHGTEVATPMVPTKVTPADEVASGTSSGSTGRPVQLNIQAMDAKSFMEYALENPAAFQAAVELALNEQGLSLKNLN